MPTSEKIRAQHEKDTRRFRILVVYCLVECAIVWFGMHSPIPALVIIVNILLVLYKGFIVSANMWFYKKQGFYHGHHNDDPDGRENYLPMLLFLVLDIAAIVFCKRNTVVFIVISVIYTLLSLLILIYTQTEYERIRDIMDGNGEFSVRIR